jgi:hypothetical protein
MLVEETNEIRKTKQNQNEKSRTVHTAFNDRLFPFHRMNGKRQIKWHENVGDA